ncbi:MAG: hypothetical protein ACLP0J_16435 [Solirubrobacteraceae bacterium]|jgi:hypothetical protein
MGRHLAFQVEGPLAPPAVALWGELRERGYSPNRVRTRMRLMVELSRWMNERGVGLGELNVGMLETLSADARRAEARGSMVPWPLVFVHVGAGRAGVSSGARDRRAGAGARPDAG